MPRTSRLSLLSVALALGLAACGNSNQNPAGTGIATLTWNRVMKNADGTNMTDLAGYQIHYGRSASALNDVVTLPNPDQTTYQVKNLSPGTWYFAVTAYSRNLRQSELSPVVSKTVK